MSFAEWEIFTAHPSQQAYVDVATPMVGSGSLRLVGSADGAGRHPGPLGLAANRGFRQGRVTTLVQPLAGVPGRTCTASTGPRPRAISRDHGHGLRGAAGGRDDAGPGRS